MSRPKEQDTILPLLCKWICGLAAAFIVQQGILNYNKDVAVMDLLASAQDKILALLAIPLQNFLAAYKAANNLLGGIPTPTVTTTSKTRLTISTTLPALRLQRMPSLPSPHPPRERILTFKTTARTSKR
jgi:hypothetical protein